MSIDPLKACTGPAVGSSRLPAVAAARQHERSFDQLLSAAEAAPLSAPALVRQATEMVRMARLQMMQGLFAQELDTSEDSLLTRLDSSDSRMALPQATGQILDNRPPAVADYQPSLLRPEQSHREEIEQLIDRVAEQVSLAPELIRSVVRVESNFSVGAVSAAGAQGLMQLMPGTARELGVVDSFDAQQNLLAGSRYLKQLLDKYQGDLDQTLAAYNWGQGNVDRKGLAQMPEETRDYLVRVKQQLAQQTV